MVDFSKVKQGDTVTIKGTVYNVLADRFLFRAHDTYMPICYLPRDIHEHFPAPRPIEVGCTVSGKGNPYFGKVIAIVNDKAWVEWNHEHNNIWNLNALTREN